MPSSDCQLLADDRRSRTAVAKGAADGSLLADCPAFPAGFYEIRPPQSKRKKPPAKKLVLEQEVEKKVPPSAGKSSVLDQDRGKEPAVLEGQVPPVKEVFSEPPIEPAGDPQPSAPLEEPLKEEKDWLHGEQGAEKPAGDEPQLKEHEQCSGGAKSPSSCSTLDQSEGEDTSRGSSQLGGECLGSGAVLWSVPNIVPASARASHMGCRESLQVVLASLGEGLQGKPQGPGMLQSKGGELWRLFSTASRTDLKWGVGCKGALLILFSFFSFFFPPFATSAVEFAAAPNTKAEGEWGLSRSTGCGFRGGAVPSEAFPWGAAQAAAGGCW